MNPKRKTSLKLLGLTKNYSVIIEEDQPSVKGQLNLLAPDITWGEATEETINTLQKKYRDKKTYHLNPPSKGFERKGIKLSFKNKGAYGYRGQTINDLIKRMM